jgi:hypothetical protein
MYFQAFILSFFAQGIGCICLAETSKLQNHNPCQKAFGKEDISPQHQIEQSRNIKDDLVRSAAAIIENRFIAKGRIIHIKPVLKDIQKFTLQIEEVGQHKDYPNFGSNYLGKHVDVFSEIGIPSSFQVGTEVSMVLRVSGDEHGQALFLVEIIENG